MTYCLLCCGCGGWFPLSHFVTVTDERSGDTWREHADCGGREVS